MINHEVEKFLETPTPDYKLAPLTSKLKCGFHTHKQVSFYSLASCISKFPSDNLPDLLGADARDRQSKQWLQAAGFPQHAPNFFPYISPRLQVINGTIFSKFEKWVGASLAPHSKPTNPSN